MIKKIALLAFSSIMAVSSVASAASSKKIKVTNESSVPYYYKVGVKTIKVLPGSSKSFPIPAKSKTINIKASTSKDGGFRTVATLTRAEAKAAPSVQSNPVSGQHTDISK
jgi:hypothetical protein